MIPREVLAQVDTRYSALEWAQDEIGYGDFPTELELAEELAEGWWE